MPEFDKSYWDEHWAPADTGPSELLPVNPYLLVETDALTPGTALESGCGEGTEALWLAERGWQVTGADISTTALARARARGAERGLADRVEWVEADLMRWEHERQWDLVVTHYAHTPIVDNSHSMNSCRNGLPLAERSSLSATSAGAGMDMMRHMGRGIRRSMGTTMGTIMAASLRKRR